MVTVVVGRNIISHNCCGRYNDGFSTSCKLLLRLLALVFSMIRFGNIPENKYVGRGLWTEDRLRRTMRRGRDQNVVIVWSLWWCLELRYYDMIAVVGGGWIFWLYCEPEWL